jgi:hypothetical protein
MTGLCTAAPPCQPAGMHELSGPAARGMGGGGASEAVGG